METQINFVKKMWELYRAKNGLFINEKENNTFSWLNELNTLLESLKISL